MSTSTQTLARALLRAASRALPEIPAELREESLAAIDAFVAAPGPANYLRACRLLQEARDAGRAAQADTPLALRSFERGLERLESLPFVEPEQLDQLAQLPCDVRAGRRLSALAALLDAHQELAARVRRVDAERVALFRPAPPEPARATAYHRVRRARRKKS